MGNENEESVSTDVVDQCESQDSDGFHIKIEKVCVLDEVISSFDENSCMEFENQNEVEIKTEEPGNNEVYFNENEILIKEENLEEVEFENNSSYEFDEDAEGFTGQSFVMPILDVQVIKKEDYMKDDISDFGEPQEITREDFPEPIEDYPEPVDIFPEDVKEEMFDHNENSDDPLTFKKEEVNKAESEEKSPSPEKKVHINQLTDQDIKLEQKKNSGVKYGIFKGCEECCESFHKTGSASGFTVAEVDWTKINMICKAKGHQGKEGVEYLPNQDCNEKEAYKEKQCLPNLKNEVTKDYGYYECYKDLWCLPNREYEDYPTDKELFRGFTVDETRRLSCKYERWSSLVYGIRPKSCHAYCCWRHVWEQGRNKRRSSKVYHCPFCDHTEVTLFAARIHQRTTHAVKSPYKCKGKTKCVFRTYSLRDYANHYTHCKSS